MNELESKISKQADVIGVPMPGAAEGNLSETKGLRPIELQFLQSIFSGSKNCVDPTPVKLRRDSLDVNYERDLYIATVSTSLFYDKYQDPELQTFSQTERQGAIFSHFKSVIRSNRFSLLTVHDDFTTGRFAEFHSHIVGNVSKRVHTLASDNRKSSDYYEHPAFVIALPEFAFPFPLGPGGQHLHNLKLSQHIDSQNGRYWETTYVLSGTQHDHDQERNIAILELPFVPRPDDTLKSLPSRDASVPEHMRTDRFKVNRHQVFHPKFSPASKIGEKLRPAEDIRWHFYDTPIGFIGVLICFDAYDPRMMLRLISLSAENAESRKFTALIVPTFSRNDEIREKCKVLSDMMQCLVIYTNAQYKVRDKDKKPIPARHTAPYWDSHGLFFCGQDIPDEADVLDGMFSFLGQEDDLFDESKDLWYCARYWKVDLNKLILASGQTGAYSTAFKRILGVDFGAE